MTSNTGIDPAAIDLPPTQSIDLTSFCAEQLARSAAH